MIKVEHLSLAYGLTNVSCHIPQGKLVGIMGANGAGKSTLLKALVGILPAVSGRILLKNHPISEMTAKQRSDQIAYLAQSPQVYWDLSVYDVLALGLPYGHKKTDEQAKVRSVSAQFSITHLLHKPFRRLSGGEKTRVQLARCCIKNAPLLLADEPIAALDPYYQIDIMQQLKALTPQHTCVVVIHHLSLAYRFCDEVVLLHHGRLAASGETKSVLTAENLAQSFAIKAEISPQRGDIFAIDKC
ncbi:ABC transporter ATP-binding protein [Necropsobacter rosorum]|uniref:ABC transporter ATP-binding protein n=1 Tax=Necropsobacter rosorum TaxID=908285 RepID=UPI0005094B79